MKALDAVRWAFPILLAAAPLAAQTTTVTGRVVDQERGSPVADAQVRVLNGNRVATTNAEGRFRLEGVVPGAQTVVAVKIGYARATVSVTVEAGKTADVEIKLAQSNVRLGDIVVTAQKEEQNIQEIPAAVAVISTEQIERAGIKTPSELTGFIPNLVEAFGGGAGFNFVSIRGVNSATGAPTYENAIAVYVDGVYQNDGANANFQFGDIDRIEVLRGPQGTLYGRGALGGVINIVTKQPTNEKRAYLMADFGNFGQMKYTANLSGPLVRDKLFVMGEALYYRRAGIYQFANGVDADKDKVFGANVRARYVATSNLTFGVNAKIERQHAFGSFPWAASKTEAFNNPHVATFGPEPNEEFRNMGSYSFEARYANRNIQLTSTTAHQRTFRGTGVAGLDVDFSPAKLLTSNYGIDGTSNEPGYVNSAVTEELRLGSAPGSTSPFKWTLGTFVYDQNSPIVTTVEVAAALSPFQLPYAADNSARLDSKGYAVFGQATYTIANQLDLTFGLRRDRHTAFTSQEGELRVQGLPATAVPLQTAEAVSKAWTPKASIAYRPNERVTIYGLWARGFRPGGNNLAGVLVSAPSRYNPEFTTNFEVGVKLASADGRVRANLTGFVNKWTDQQVNTYDFSTFTSVTLNTGKSTSKGVELELSALPSKYVQFDWNLGVISAKFDSLNLSLNPQLPVRYDGNYLAITPKVTSTPAVQFDIPVGRHQLVVRGEWRYLGKHYFDLANSIEQDGYSLFNARASYKIRDVEVAVWGRNLGNKVYVAFAQAFGGTRTFLGEPRTVGVTLSTRLWQ